MYSKIFASLYQGTLRGRSDAILVFTNLLAHCDREGYVDKHWKAISDETGLPIDRVKEACIELEAPDPESRSQELDGARLERIADNRAWGWRVVNYLKYRAIKNEDERREQNRIAQSKHRNKSKQPSAIVSKRKQMSAQGEGEGEGHGDGIGGVPPNPQGTPPVEPPVGWPRAEDEAVAIGERSGVPGEFTARKWNEAMGVGYVDWNGKPIRSFAHWIKSEFGRHQENEKRIANRNQAGGKPQRPNRNEGTFNTGDAERYRRSGNVVSFPDAP